MGLFSLTRRVGRDAAVAVTGGAAALVLGQRRDKPASTPMSSKAAPASSAGQPTASTATIRDWARTNGHPISPRGRLGADIVDAFNAAH